MQRGHNLRNALYIAALAAILLLGLWLFWPSLGLGLFADDFTATAMMDHKFAAPRAPLDLFDFADGSLADLQRLRRLGSVPWWAPYDFRVAFLRPLSAALFYLDRAAFGDALVAHHLHSIAAWALLVIAATLLYRRLFSTGVALCATLMFAIDDSHHFAVIWLSNRGGIYALFVATLALLAQLRFRQSGRARDALACAALSSIALAFGEWALPIFGYMLAYEIAGAHDSFAARMRGLLVPGLPAGAFLVLRALLGYGARGSGAYVDPFAEPARFALAALQRIVVFAGDMVWNLPSSWWDQGTPWRERLLDLDAIPPRIWRALPGWPPLHFALGLLAFGALGLALKFSWRGLSPRERIDVRWLLLGALISLIPVVGSFPSTRLTLAAFLGFAPVAALVLRELFRRLAHAEAARLGRFFFHYGLALALLWFQVAAPLTVDIAAQVDGYATTVKWVLGAELDPTRVAKQRVFVLNGAEFTTTFFFAYIWSHFGRPLPRSYYPITTAPYAQEIERVASDTLRLRALGGSYLGSGQENMFSSPARKFKEGETIGLPGMWITAESITAGLPRSLLVRFERSVDDPSYVFLSATPRGFKRFTPPELGERRVLPRAAYPSWLALERGRREQRFGLPPEELAYTVAPPFIAYLRP